MPRAVNIDRGPCHATVRAYPGDDLTIVVLMSDFTSGPYLFTGATITCAVGGQAMTVVSANGRLECTLSDTQTTTLGEGPHSWVLAITEDGVRQTYVDGTVFLAASGFSEGSDGYDVAVVNNVLVGVG